METKTCQVCGKTLPISEFYRNSATADGLDYRCKECNINHRTKTKTYNRKAFSIHEVSDDALCGELRRRGYEGELVYKKMVVI